MGKREGETTGDHASARERYMKSEEARLGAMVRVREHYRIAERRGMVGRIVDRYGGEEYIAVDVRFPDEHKRLFWPEDLEEISFFRPWWRSLRGRGSAG